MVDGFSLVCQACGRAADLSAGLAPNADGQLICAGCGAEIPIPLAAPDDSQGDTTTASPADLATVVDPRHQVHPAGADTIESVLGDCGSGRYDERETIGKGGMGEIVLCVEQNTRREVAMKRMLPTAAGHAKQRARFVEEAQVTAQLEHPNIVPVHELGRDEHGAIYFTMKLVKGRSLAEILTASRDGAETHSLGEMLQMFLKVCDGVAFAHSRGVVHRDLKPANIMVGDFGEVLVMDWGIARIIGSDEIADEEGVQTNRQDTDQPALHTMDGAIMGSPSYMPPEQAAGEIDKIDHRSDIYSLGAILYEILTLKRPFEGGDARAIVTRVIEGNIQTPERRAPGRDIPRELSAVAMKCLAKYRPKRYASVPDLQRDVSLYLEGRSVSAAPDTFARALVKLVKRNKPVSLAVAAAVVILIAVVSVAFIRVTGAMQRAITERQTARAARDKQRATALAASQELSERAVRAADQERWIEADISVAAARKMLPDCPWGHYAAGMVALARKDRQAARMELKKALACDPGHTLSKAALGRIAALEGRLVEAANLLGDPGKTKDWHAFRTAGDTLTSQKRYRDAETAYVRALELFARPQRLGDDQKDWRALVAMGDAFVAGEFYADAAAAYERAKEQMGNAKAVPPKAPNQVAEKLKSTRKARETSKGELEDKKGNATAWVKCEGFYESIKDLGAKEQGERIKGKLKDIHGRDIGFRYDIEDGVLVGVALDGGSATKALYLQPLVYLPLTRLLLHRAGVRDLAQLKGMPLKSLRITECAFLKELSPLKGMPLTTLRIEHCALLKDLTPLKGMSLTKLDMAGCRLLTDLRPLNGMPLKELNLHETPVTDLTPLKGMPLEKLQITHAEVTDLTPLKGMGLKELNVSATRVTDLGPLKGMPLKTLNISGTKIMDLTPLKGMPLRVLHISETRVTDLTPLRSMSLTRLGFGRTRVKDLGPLKGMPLTSLDCSLTAVSDLGPLKGMPLTSLDCGITAVSDLGPLKGMPLTSLKCSRTAVSDLRPLKGIPLRVLYIDGTKIMDLTPVEGMKLETFTFTPKNITKGIEIVRGMKSLQKIGLDRRYPANAEEFWKKYDAGKK
ncbi:MAG: protein kinase [Phycisphaerae bacterium]|nr:protein kinase [Phycisphaerae bacterium]